MIVLRRFILFAVLWLVLGTNEGADWLMGALAAAAATSVSLVLLPPLERRVRPAAVLGLAPGFFIGSLKGGLDVARRAFDPRMPLKPGWILHPLRLPRGTSRAALGGEVSLMPGTLPAGDDGRHLLVHCLDLDQPLAETLDTEERRIAASIGFDLEKSHG